MTAKLIGQKIELHVAANDTGFETVATQEVMVSSDAKDMSSLAPSHLADNGQSDAAIMNIIPSKSSLLTSSSLKALNTSMHQVGNRQSEANPIVLIDFHSTVRRSKSKGDGLGCCRSTHTRRNGCLTWAAFLG